MPFICEKLDKSQFAFRSRSGAGCTTALTIIYHRILKFLDSDSGAVRVLTTDFSKAFDVLSHQSIINACIKFDLTVQSIALIRDFLSDRKQRVKIGSEVSTWKPCTSGVPQGSVLGHILFIMATNNIRPVCDNSSIVRYADDLTFLHFVRQETEDKLQLEWEHINQWATDIELPLNFRKCHLMDIVTRRDLVLGNITSNNANLEKVENMRILGLTFSADMKWNLHIDSIIKKVSTRMCIIYNLKRANCPSSVIFRTYEALIRSVILYSYPCFCNIPYYLKEKLSRVEKRVIRIINDPNFVYVSLFDAAEKMCHSLFTSVLNNSEHPLQELFEHRLKTARNSCNLRPPHTRTKRLKRSFISFCRH